LKIWMCGYEQPGHPSGDNWKIWMFEYGQASMNIGPVRVGDVHALQDTQAIRPPDTATGVVLSTSPKKASAACSCTISLLLPRTATAISQR
jgi:hypothetical protein